MNWIGLSVIIVKPGVILGLLFGWFMLWARKECKILDKNKK